MTIWQAVLLGIIQGLTEFLPVSSSGHLVIGQYFLGLKEPELLFDTGVHFATVIAVVIYFRKDIIKLLTSLIGKDQNTERRTAYAIIIGTIPAVFVGLFFKDFLESFFSSPQMASYMLILTGVLLFTSFYAKPQGKKLWGIKWLDALIIGIAQAISIMPGISRSGATITTALHLGFENEDAARFSFLLSLPAIFGAGILQAIGLSAITTQELIPLVFGMFSAGITGYFAIAFMLKLVGRGKLYAFSPYCIIVGLIVLIIL